MTTRYQYDVCASVISDLEFDARVWKEARSLGRAERTVALHGPYFDLDRSCRDRDPSGVEVYKVPFGRRQHGKSYVQRISALLRVWAGVLRTNARVYHAHDIHVAIPSWIASRVRGARLVYDAHELWAEAYTSGLRARLAAMGGKLLERLMVRNSDAVITTNPSRAEALSSRYGRSDITVLANVPFLSGPGHPPAGWPSPGKRTILYLGRISARGRAFLETIQALRLLDADVEFVIVGFGWEAERDQIRQWARELKVRDRVHVLPPMPFEQLAEVAAAATVGLVPIYGWPLSNRLGDTNKLHEYLMGGLPVVASDLPEIRRVVQMGDPSVGEVFDPGSAQSIADAVAKVIDDSRYQERRSEARRLAEERFNWGIEEDKLLALYDGILADRSGGVAEFR